MRRQTHCQRWIENPQQDPFTGAIMNEFQQNEWDDICEEERIAACELKAEAEETELARKDARAACHTDGHLFTYGHLTAAPASIIASYLDTKPSRYDVPTAALVTAARAKLNDKLPSSTERPLSRRDAIFILEHQLTPTDYIDAARKGLLGVMRFYIELPRAPGTGGTALKEAIIYNREAVVELLLQNGVRLSPPDDNYYIQYIAMSGNLRLLELCIRYREVALDQDGLSNAISAESQDLVHFFLNRGIRPQISDILFTTKPNILDMFVPYLFLVSIHTQNIKDLQRLLNIPGYLKPNPIVGTILKKALLTGKTQVVEYMHEQYEPVDESLRGLLTPTDPELVTQIKFQKKLTDAERKHKNAESRTAAAAAARAQQLQQEEQARRNAVRAIEENPFEDQRLPSAVRKRLRNLEQQKNDRAAAKHKK